MVGLEKPGVYFYLNSLFLMSEVFQMALRVFMSLLDDFDPQKIEVSKLMREFVIKKNILSIQSVLLFLTLYCTNTKNFLFFY